MVLIGFMVLCFLTFKACDAMPDMNDDGPDDGECYYDDPIPHYDTCR
jgi:hypothetical protein